MKRFLGPLIAVFAMALSFVSCSKFDDSELWAAINKNSSEIAALKEKCTQLNSDVSNLQQLVSALAAEDYVTDCIALTDGKGYTLVFKSGKTVMVECGADGRDGKDGIDGKDGQDGCTPTVGVARDADGNWYWTLDGGWLLDASGNKVKANGNDGKDGRDGADAPVPMFKIENGMWNVSLDGGATWTELGKATGEDGKDGKDGDGDASLFKDVIVGTESITFVLADGSAITLPFNPSEQASPAITGECTNVDDVSAEIIGWCKLDGSEGLSVVFGIEYSDFDLTRYGYKCSVEGKDSEGKFVCFLTDLKAKTKYYYRAFAYFNGAYYYGDVKTFTTTEQEVVDATVSQVIFEQNENAIYRLTGTVSRFNSQYCSFDLTDETGTIYVYSVDADTMTEYSSKLANGDTVTIEGEYQFYAKASQHEIVNAKITTWTKGSDDGGQGGDGVDPSTLSQITCAEFNALSDSDNGYYILEGDVTTVENTQYGNLYIKDASGEEAYIYGLNGKNGEAFGTLNVAKGDKIKIYGQHTIYNNTTVEMKGAKLLSLTKGQGGDDSIGEAIFTLSFPDDNSASNKVNGYDKPWTAKSGSYSFTMTAFNNYEWKDWTYIRCGRKAASVASIATDNAISEAVSKVVIAIDKITASDINSISLIVAKDASFSNVVETVAVNAARGDVEAAISSPAAGLYYKLVFDCKASSEKKNGFVQVSSLKFMK